MGFSYEAEYCRPFTLIFFKKTQDPLSKIIHINTKRCLDVDETIKPIWTHVGIVIDKTVCRTINIHKDEVELVDNEPYIWESTISNNSKLFNDLDRVYDSETKRCHFGVQLRRLSSVFNSALNSGIDIAYTCSYCDLVKTEDLDVLKLQFLKLKHPYNLFSIYSHHEGERKITTSSHAKAGTMFSSQFVTMVLQSVGAIPNTNAIDCRLMLPQELAYPSDSDNETFKGLFEGDNTVRINIIKSSVKSSNACVSVVSDLIFKLASMGYKHGIALALNMIYQRIPESKKILEGLADKVVA